MRQITITIPGKIHPSLNALNRMHWAAKGKLKKEWETEIFWLVKAQGWRVPLKRAQVRITYYLGGNYRADKDNRTPKMIMDGLVKAGVLEDDNTRAVDLDWEIHPGKPRRTEIRVTEID